MSIFPVAILLAIVTFAAAMSHLNQSAGSYFDLVALLMVFGGTISVALVLMPWGLKDDLKLATRRLFKTEPLSSKEVLQDCLSALQSGRVESTGTHLYQRILRDGFELLDLGIEGSKAKNILLERVLQHGRRHKKIANAFKSLSKYPPAFGLMGTVLGLVNVMNGVSKGQSAKQTAFEMALALVATMYGLILSNVVINPAGELIVKHLSEEEVFGEIAISSVMMRAEQTSMLEAQETLNSFAPERDQLKMHDLQGAGMDA